jgi:hypothetical protein
MRELLGSAVSGWISYTSAGKFAVLFLGILLWSWCIKRFAEQKEKQLLIYASAVAVLAVFPPGAALLMKYQTAFYDYKWIWSAVPVTLVIAWGMTVLCLEQCRARWQGKIWKPAGFLALLLAVILLCGNLNTDGCKGAAMSADRAATAGILDKLAESGDTESICMWAPEQVLAHVRELNGGIRLLYGRNMWEASLNAYAYDSYSQDVAGLYQWMKIFCEEQEIGTREELVMTDIEAVGTAIRKGVNCILIPEGKADEISGDVEAAAKESALSVTQLEAEGYLIYWLRP